MKSLDLTIWRWTNFTITRIVLSQRRCQMLRECRLPPRRSRRICLWKHSTLMINMGAIIWSLQQELLLATVWPNYTLCRDIYVPICLKMRVLKILTIGRVRSGRWFRSLKWSLRETVIEWKTVFQNLWTYPN